MLIPQKGRCLRLCTHGGSQVRRTLTPLQRRERSPNRLLNRSIAEFLEPDREPLGQVREDSEPGNKRETAKADAGLRSACLDTLKALCEDTKRQESIAHISQAGQEAVKAFDAALAKIAEAANKAQPAGVKDATRLKTRRVVEPAKLVKKSYLETEADVDTFLDELGGQLRQAIAKNERVEIR